MSEPDDKIEQLREQFAGNYVAWLDDTVILSSETYGELCDRLEEMPVDQARVSIEYLEPADVVRVY